ncbi:DUF805 domain-containing protein [Rubrivirga marina]|uniref:DUF805 domain-containing protein n=1 Tax=Rubrivirga marina TaxID=1196024 RepID=A0A271IZ63_9BACT|nr:DUF805 domain-containing protein [Rubrivirga marina]PAP76502.1 hypothetical protein BSZ37_08640 [Rubrivirga marina]
MTPAAAYLHVLAAFADFDGRASRAELWGFVLVHTLVMGVLVVASAVVGRWSGMGWIAGSAVVALYLAVSFFPALSAVARRLHDTGRSSLLVALGLVPIVGLLLLYWLVLPGEPGPNRYGQPPE